MSIGNIEAGGTGKSPVVMSLLKELSLDGISSAVVTRGYKSGLKKNEFAVLKNGQTLLLSGSSNFVADEARMQSANLPDTPIIIGANRVLATSKYLERFPAPKIWILDDGYQHFKIQRDFDLLLLDWDKPFDNGWPLPTGHLREFPNAMERCSAILFTRASHAKKDLHKFSHKNHYLSEFTSENIRHIAGPIFQKPLADAKFCLASGIAKPDQLKESIRKANVFWIREYLVADHQSFLKEGFQKHLESCDGILTTEKDYYRDPDLFQGFQIPVYIIELKAQITNFYKSTEFQSFIKICD